MKLENLSVSGLQVVETDGKRGYECLMCKAQCSEANELNRFLRRHPTRCQERKSKVARRAADMKQLAATTRAVDADEAVMGRRDDGDV